MTQTSSFFNSSANIGYLFRLKPENSDNEYMLTLFVSSCSATIFFVSFKTASMLDKAGYHQAFVNLKKTTVLGTTPNGIKYGG